MGLGLVSGGINRKLNEAGTACLELDWTENVTEGRTWRRGGEKK